MNVPMIEDLTDEEREFMSSHRGGIFAILNGGEGAVQDARSAVAELIKTIEARYPSRTERLLIFSTFAHLTTHARDELLDEILATRFNWRRRTRDGEWCALAWETHETNQLVSLANLARQTINVRIKRVAASTLDEAKAADEPCPDDPDGVHHIGCECEES